MRRLLLACGVAAALALLAAPGGGARAEGAWRSEFDALCAKTQDAMALPTDELKALVARCDALAPALEKLEPSERKVFSRRLKACRDLYRFVLEAREKGAG